MQPRESKHLGMEKSGTPVQVLEQERVLSMRWTAAEIEQQIAGRPPLPPSPLFPIYYWPPDPLAAALDAP